MQVPSKVDHQSMKNPSSNFECDELLAQDTLRRNDHRPFHSGHIEKVRAHLRTKFE